MNPNQILTYFVDKLNANPNGMTPSEQRHEIELLEQRIMFSATQFSEMLVGADALIPGDLPVEILGDNGNNEIVGTELDEIINGGEGNDDLLGGAGDDELRGGDGNDVLNAGTGFDGIYGGDGYDTVQILSLIHI